MNGRNIPGYYWDEEKRKYFKIQSARDAPRPDSKYSASSIKQEKKRKLHAGERRAGTAHERHKIAIDPETLSPEQYAAEKHAKKLKKDRVSRLMATPSLGSASLNRELGLSTTRTPTGWPTASASGFQKHHMLRERPVSYFDIDPITRKIYAAHSDASICRHKLVSQGDMAPFRRHSEQLPISDKPGKRYYVMNAHVTSLNYMPASGAMVVTTQGADNRPPIIQLSNPNRDGPAMSEQFSCVNSRMLFSSAPKPLFPDTPGSIPATETEIVAVGSSNHLFLPYRRPEGGTWQQGNIIESDSDILSLAWMSPTVLAYGCRDRTIKLYDTRSEGQSTIVYHDTPVGSLRRADDATRLVCAGLNSNVSGSLCLYDFRMPKSIRPTKKRNNRHRGLRYTSNPYLEFKRTNTASLDLGLDVHVQLGLVAAADDQQNVLIWSLRTGEQVRKFTQAGQHIQCMRFLEDDGAESGVSLWAGTHRGLERFGW